MDGFWATKSESVRLIIVRAISFQDFQPMWSMVMIHQRHGQTDRRTDGWTDDMRSQYRALHYSASRGKNTERRDRDIENENIVSRSTS